MRVRSPPRPRSVHTFQRTPQLRHLHSRITVFVALTTLLSCDPSANRLQRAQPTGSRLLTRTEALRSSASEGCERDRLADISVALRADSNDLGAHLALANVCLRRAERTGRHRYYFGEASGMLREILRRRGISDAQRTDALVALGRVQRGVGDYVSALHTTEQAVRLQPCTARAYGIAFDCHMELGQYAEAEDAIAQMLALQPSKCAYARLSELLEVRGDIPGAMDALESALAARDHGREDEAWARITRPHRTPARPA